MKFKNDNHRKAVFANMFNRGSRDQTKVSLSGVKNFETKTTKMKQSKLPKFKVEPVRLKDIKTKEGKVFCGMCKRKGLSLKKGKCKDCIKETKKFKQSKLNKMLSEDLVDTLEFFLTDSRGLDELIYNAEDNLIPEEDLDEDEKGKRLIATRGDPIDLDELEAKIPGIIENGEKIIKKLRKDGATKQNLEELGKVAEEITDFISGPDDSTNLKDWGLESDKIQELQKHFKANKLDEKPMWLSWEWIT